MFKAKRLWVYEKAQKTRTKLLVFLMLVLAATYYFFAFSEMFSKLPYASVCLVVAWFGLFCFYVLVYEPLALIEDGVSGDMLNLGYSLAKDQGVSVHFLKPGVINYIFYKDFSYRQNPSVKVFYKVTSGTVVGEVQVHYVDVEGWSTSGFAVVTEMLDEYTVRATVYSCE